MSRISIVKEEFLNSPEVKRLQELEKYIDSNEKINKAFAKLKEIQRKMVNSKELNDEKSYKIYKKNYQDFKNELFELPFVEEYFELSDFVNQKLIYFCQNVEDELKNELNK